MWQAASVWAFGRHQTSSSSSCWERERKVWNWCKRWMLPLNIYRICSIHESFPSTCWCACTTTATTTTMLRNYDTLRRVRRLKFCQQPAMAGYASSRDRIVEGKFFTYYYWWIFIVQCGSRMMGSSFARTACVYAVLMDSSRDSSRRSPKAKMCQRGGQVMRELSLFLNICYRSKLEIIPGRKARGTITHNTFRTIFGRTLLEITCGR